MSDLIDRDEVLKVIRELSAIDLNNTDYADGFANGYNAGIRDVEPKWIPAAERLPEVYSKVLVTRKAFLADFILVDLAYFNASKTLWETEELSDVDVLAWMPLPQPWKGEENDK